MTTRILPELGPKDLYINGKWLPSEDGQRFDVVDPASEDVIASVASGNIEDARKAVWAAPLPGAPGRPALSW